MNGFELAGAIRSETFDQSERLGGRDGHEMPGGTIACVAEGMDHPFGYEDDRTCLRCSPLLPGQVVDLAVEHVEDFLELLVPVLEGEPAAGRKIRFEHPDERAARFWSHFDGQGRRAQLQPCALTRRHQVCTGPARSGAWLPSCHGH